MTTLTPQKPAAAPTGGPPVEPRILGFLSPEGAVMLALLSAAFFGLFFRWFYIQHLSSSAKLEDWGHAYAIPFMSGYLVWRARHKLLASPPSTFWPALPVVLLGIMSYFLCVVGIKNHMLQGFSIILTLFGLVLLMLGPRPMRYLFLPVALLVFGVTVSDIIMIQLTFPLQLIASQGAYLILSVIGAVAGFSVDVAGNTLNVITSSARSIPLNVAEACSGMRMVVAFFALAAITGILGCRFWWQRTALVLLAAPVAILINIVRVAALGLLSMADQNLASGQAHTLIGTLLLIPGLLLFLLVVWTLNKIVGDDRSPRPPGVPA